MTLTREMRLIYLAAPYSSEFLSLRSWRAEQAARAASRLMADGFHVFAPTVHGHAIDRWTHHSDHKIEYTHWVNTGLDFLQRSNLLYVLNLPGWDQSLGVKAEINLALSIGLPILMLDFRTGLTLEPGIIYEHTRLPTSSKPDVGNNTETPGT